MKPAILRGYIICDSQGGCRDYSLRTNQRDCWQAFLLFLGYAPDRHKKERARFKRLGFRCARVWVKDAEVTP
jgi:hypothetical protein